MIFDLSFRLEDLQEVLALVSLDIYIKYNIKCIAKCSLWQLLIVKKVRKPHIACFPKTTNFDISMLYYAHHKLEHFTSLLKRKI